MSQSGCSLPKERDSRWERGRRSGGKTPCPIHPHPGAVPRDFLIPLFAAPGRLPWSNLPRKRAHGPPSLRRTPPLALRHCVKVQNAWLVFDRCRRLLVSPWDACLAGRPARKQNKPGSKRGFSGGSFIFLGGPSKFNEPQAKLEMRRIEISYAAPLSHRTT